MGVGRGRVIARATRVDEGVLSRENSQTLLVTTCLFSAVTLSSASFLRGGFLGLGRGGFVRGRLRSRNVRSRRARGIARAHRGERVETVRLRRGRRRALLLQQTPRLCHRGARHLHGLAAARGERGDAGHDARAGRGDELCGILRGRVWRLERHARVRLGCARASVEVASLSCGGGFKSGTNRNKGVAESNPVKKKSQSNDEVRSETTQRDRGARDACLEAPAPASRDFVGP